MQYETRFGSIDDYDKGGVEIIDDDPKNYVFSNLFEVAKTSAPYERIAVGKNFEYVIECARAEGTSGWYACAHDEFALSMDGEIEVHLVKLDNPDSVVDPASQGAHALQAAYYALAPMYLIAALMFFGLARLIKRSHGLARGSAQ